MDILTKESAQPVETAAVTAPVIEIYATVQGEGPYTGERQVFLRLGGCPLRCRYCDTPGSLLATGHPVLGAEETHRAIVAACRQSGTQTVSVTGGEPLAHPAFLAALFPMLKRDRLRIYLETAGVHPRVMADVAPWCDVIAMDIKLPSATGRPLWEEHRAALAAAGPQAFVKMVIEERSGREEIDMALALIAAARPVPLLILQPASAVPGASPPSVQQVADVFARATACLPRVLVMGQMHRVWGVR